VSPHGDFGRRPLYTLNMGVLSAVLDMPVGGYSLGIRTASVVLRDDQAAFEDGSPEPIARPSTLPIAVVGWAPERNR
jgi:hypothetical protein